MRAVSANDMDQQMWTLFVVQVVDDLGDRSYDLDPQPRRLLLEPEWDWDGASPQQQPLHGPCDLKPAACPGILQSAVG